MSRTGDAQAKAQAKVPAKVPAKDPAKVMTTWASLIGHDRVAKWFGAAIAQNRLGGSFLLVGAAGIGKRTVADLLARTLLCERRAPAAMDPCGTCSACIQVSARTHPDVIRVGKPHDKSLIPVELLIGPRDARMQQGFCRDIRLRPMSGTRKVAILEDADFLNEEGANCLLKTLEEPPAGAVVLLIGTSEQRQLPTIRSRCQIVRMGPLSSDAAAELLRTHHHVDADDAEIAAAVQIAGGDLHVAAGMLSGQTEAIRSTLAGLLGQPHPDPVALSRLVTKYVDGAGKDASKRRAAMRDLFAMSVQHFRGQMRAAADRREFDPRSLARLDRSIRAIREVERSANQATLIECWSVDIARATTGDRGAIG